MRGTDTVAVVVVGAVPAEEAQHIMQFLRNYCPYSLQVYFMEGTFMRRRFMVVSIFFFIFGKFNQEIVIRWIMYCI